VTGFVDIRAAVAETGDARKHSGSRNGEVDDKLDESVVAKMDVDYSATARSTVGKQRKW